MSTVETQVRPTPTRSLQAGYDKRLMVTAGRASTELGGKIAEKLGVNLTDAGLKTFANGEVYCKYEDSIRGADLFIIQSTCTNETEGLTANDALMELMCMIDAAVGASAHRVIAVTPWYGYSRQDKKSAPREPISARLVAEVLETAGIDRLVLNTAAGSSVEVHHNIVQQPHGGFVAASTTDAAGVSLHDNTYWSAAPFEHP